MKIQYEELDAIFECSNIVSNSRELLWYRRAWEILEQTGYTSCEDDLGELRIHLGAYALIDMFSDFANIIFENDNEQYEFYTSQLSELWDDREPEMYFGLGMLYSEISGGENEMSIDIENFFYAIIGRERQRLTSALLEGVGEHWGAKLYVSMMGAMIDAEEVYNDTDAYYDEEETEEEYDQRLEEYSMNLSWRREHPYEAYRQDIENYYANIVNDVFDSAVEAYYWVGEGLDKR